MDAYDDSGDTIDTGSAATLFGALVDPDLTIRAAALAALVVLPLSPDVWIEVARYANTVLLDPTRPAAERLAVVEAAPWIPIASTRDHVNRLTTAPAVEPELGDAAAQAQVKIERARRLPSWSPVAPAGFCSLDTAERDRLRRELANSPVSTLLSDLRRAWQSGDRTRAAYVVTLLLETAEETDDARAYEAVLAFVEGATGFSPDLDGLLELLLRDDAATHRIQRGSGIPWILSRGGVANLLRELEAPLTSDRRDLRLAALALIPTVAGLAGLRRAPTSKLSVGMNLGYPRGKVPPRSDVLDVDVTEVSIEDDDVQFSLYRPSQVRPDEWVPLVAFAHRTAPVTMPDGRVVKPVEEVERRAAQLLADMPTSYDVVRADSDAGLPRGTDLRFEPWIEEGEFNPSAQTVRWEEAVHEMHFRLRVPGSRDGTRVRGGLRVFAGALLVGDLGFRILVSRDELPGAVKVERDTTHRFRQIFASYSHRDAAVVDAVARFVSVTGDRYLIDAETLRSGEVWDDRLCELIDAADVFQLFWSRNAMNSQFVRREWEYALALGRDGFVRPVYWEDPLAEDPDRNLPPAALMRLHFSRLAVDLAPPVAEPAYRPPSASDQVPKSRDAASPAGSAPVPSPTPNRRSDQRLGKWIAAGLAAVLVVVIALALL